MKSKNVVFTENPNVLSSSRLNRSVDPPGTGRLDGLKVLEPQEPVRSEAELDTRTQHGIILKELILAVLEEESYGAPEEEPEQEGWSH